MTADAALVSTVGDVFANAHPAPVSLLSVGPPINAVLPSEESATLLPNPPSPLTSLPVSFAPCWVQVAPERVNTHAPPTLVLSAGPPIRRGIAVGGQRHAVAEFAFAGLFVAGELGARLGPGRARARNTHAAPTLSVVARAADQRGVAGGGERHADAELACAALSLRR